MDKLLAMKMFVATVDAQGFSAAARRLGLATSSVTRLVDALEASLGATLLNRSTRQVSLTEAGAALAHHARLILQQQAQLRGELQAFAHGARGTLHLYANTAALTNYLPSRLAPWLAERPRLHVELLERTSPEVVRAINAGQAEAGIISDAVDAAGLQQHVVAEDPLVMLLPAEHRFASRRSVAFADVAGETFVALADGNALQAYIEDQARNIGRRLDVRIRMKTFEGVCIMVGHGIGLGIVPRTIARQHRRNTRTVAVPLADAWAQRRLCACFAGWAQLSPAMRSLLLHLGVQPQKNV